MTLKGNEPVKLQSIQYGQMSGLLDNSSGIVGVSLYSLSIVQEIEGTKALLMGKKSQPRRKRSPTKPTQSLPGCIHSISRVTS